MDGLAGRGPAWRDHEWVKLLVDGRLSRSVRPTAAMAPTLAQAIEVARCKAFVILGGTLLRIDRVGMAGGRDRPYCSGKHTCHGVNV